MGASGVWIDDGRIVIEDWGEIAPGADLAYLSIFNRNSSI
jgi:hypothetical protein